MRTRWITIVCGILPFVLAMAGCATPLPSGSTGHPPVIDDYKASPTVQMGKMWKFFIKAHDPDGEMWQIRFYPQQEGFLWDDEQGYVTLPKNMRAEFDGYFYLRAPEAERNIKWTVYIIDRAGLKSQTIEVNMVIGQTPAAPDPPGFADQRLLNIPYALLQDFK